MLELLSRNMESLRIHCKDKDFCHITQNGMTGTVTDRREKTVSNRDETLSPKSQLT